MRPVAAERVNATVTLFQTRHIDRVRKMKQLSGAQAERTSRADEEISQEKFELTSMAQ